MLTLGIVNGRTDYKTNNLATNSFRGRPAAANLLQKWVVGLVTLGPNCTHNVGKETTDDSLGEKRDQ